MRSFLAPCLRLPLAVAVLTAAGCSSNAVPLPADDATLLTPGAVRAAERGEEAEAEPAPAPAETTNSETPDPEALTHEATASTFAGTVEKYTLTPSYNFFMHGRMETPGKPHVLILVQTDHPELCDHLAAGTMPRNATMFAVAMMREDGKELPDKGKFLAPLDRGRVAPLLGMAYFRALDDECMVSPMPAINGVEADYGTVELLQYTAGQSAQARYSLTLNTNDVVEGHITATYCNAPLLFEKPEALQVPEVEPANCR